MSLISQTWTLTAKTIRIALFRHAFTTTIRAFVLPVAFMLFLAYARNLFIPPSKYGIGTPTPVRSLANAMEHASGGRHILAFVNNGLAGGDIDRVAQAVAAPAQALGKEVHFLESETDLLDTCRSSLRGTSFCFGAAVFHSSPTEGTGGKWNYTLRADDSLGIEIHVDKTTNDMEVFVLPLQRAIDQAIASTTTGVDQTVISADVEEYPYTSLTLQQRKDQIVSRIYHLLVM
jgi:ATP-binding cassette, subfamily A (ABC1), member 3